MKFWQSISWAETEQLCEIAKFAEQVGFDGVLCADHALYPKSLSGGYPYSESGMPPQDVDSEYADPWGALAAALAATRTLRAGSGVFVLPLRNPIDVAKQAATLALISGDRFLFGIGAGWMKEEFDIYGVDFQTRIARMEEMIEILHGLWSGELFEYHGRFFDFQPIKVTPTPQKKIPLFFGGSSPGALQRTAQLGDGWINAGNTAEELQQLLARLRELRREAGREDHPFETICAIYGEPDADLYRRLAADGMDGVVSFPFSMELGVKSSIDDKKRMMERYAKTIIQHCQ